MIKKITIGKRSELCSSKITIWISSLLMVVVLCVPVSYADDDEDTECGKGFVSFLSTVVDLQDFSVYWYDIFTKNMCEIEDIFALEEELDSIRESIREKYYACDYDGLSEMETEYKAKKMELYFVRNAASSALESMTGSEIEILSSEITVYLEGFLYDEMYGKFVTEKEWFKGHDFDVYFYSFIEKYSDNIENYLTGACGWSGVVEKWNHIGETVSAIKEAFRPEDDKDDEDTPAEAGAKDAPKNGEDGFFQKHFDFLFEPTTSFPGFPDSSYGGGITDSFDSYVESLDTYDTEYNEAQLLAKYKTLYSEGGAEISSALSASLQELEDILTISAKTDIPNAKKLAHKIAKKQCGN